MKLKYWLLLFLIIPFALQAKLTINVPKTHQPPVIDGVIENGEWIEAVIIDTF